MWDRNKNDLIHRNSVKLLKECTYIDGIQIEPPQIADVAEKYACGGNIIRSWSLKYYYVSDKKIDWQILLNDKQSKLGEVKLEDVLSKGTKY